MFYKMPSKQAKLRDCTLEAFSDYSEALQIRLFAGTKWLGVAGRVFGQKLGWATSGLVVYIAWRRACMFRRGCCGGVVRHVSEPCSMHAMQVVPDSFINRIEPQKISVSRQMKAELTHCSQVNVIVASTLKAGRA